MRDCRCCIHMSLLCVHVHTSLKDCCLVDVITSVTASLSLPYAHAYVTISLSLSLTSLKDCISVLCVHAYITDFFFSFFFFFSHVDVNTSQEAVSAECT